MTLIPFCFLLGYLAGLRSLTAPAVVCWAAHLGWLHFSGTKLAFINEPSTLIVFTVLAVVELIADKLPRTPARTAPLGLIARVVVGASIGVILATSAGMGVPFPMMVAVIGALVGTFGGYNIRRVLVSKGRLPDFAVALAEDMIAIAGGLLIVSHL
jgi:uncharacterized membrane protein